jgi:hypothetical protein
MGGITKKKNLNPKRRDRVYPRVVKRARHNSYRVKRPGDHGTRHPARSRSAWSTSASSHSQPENQMINLS